MSTPDFMSVLKSDGVVERWSMSCSTNTAARSHELVLTDTDGTEWHAQASDVFECVVQLRLQLEPLELRLCCNASRRDAWASGMQRDMGSGFAVYLLADAPVGTRPPDVPTLGYAPPDDTVSYAEQHAWHERWLASRSE